MFDLDGVRFGDNYSFPFDTPYIGEISHIYWSSFFSGGGNGAMCVDDIEYRNLESLPQ